MWSHMVIDIETFECLSDPLKEKLLKEVKPHKTIKDPEKAAAYIEKQKRKILEKAALDPLTGKIVATGIGVKTQNQPWEFACFAGPDERQILESLDDCVRDYAVTTFVTYNGEKFDFPFLAARAMVRGMKLQCPWPLGRSHRHIDLWQALGRDHSLDSWAMACFGKGKKSSGSEIHDMVNLGEWPAVKQHCIDDVKITADLYDRYITAVDVGGKKP